MATFPGGVPPAVADGYRPNQTLGRSGYESSPEDRLHERVAQLDALLLVVTTRGEPDQPAEGFDNCNAAIQSAVLDLASSLATEIHELHAKICFARAEHRMQRAGVAHG